MPVTAILFARAIPPDFLAPGDAARRWRLEQVLQIAGEGQQIDAGRLRRD